MDERVGMPYGQRQEGMLSNASSAAPNLDHQSDVDTAMNGAGDEAYQAEGLAADAGVLADKHGTQTNKVGASTRGSTLAHAMPYSALSTNADALHVPGRGNDGRSTDEASGSTPLLATTGTDLSTPEAHWGSSTTGLSSAPLVTLTSEFAVEQDLFDLNNRPYTPSYSAGDFSDILSDQDEFLKSFGDQIEGASFAFGVQSGGIAPSFDYDPDTADSYSQLNSTLLSQNLLGGGTSSGGQKRSQTLETIRVDTKPSSVPTFAFSHETGYRDTAGDTQHSPTASPLLGPVSSPLHTRHSSFGSSAEFSSPNPAKSDADPAVQQMQTLGQRMTLHDPIAVRPPDEQAGRQTYARSPQAGSLFFAPVFEEETTGGAVTSDSGQEAHDHDAGSSTGYPAYTYGSAKGEQVSTSASLPSLTVNQTAVQFDEIRHPSGSAQHEQQFPPPSQHPWPQDVARTSSAEAQAASYASLAQGSGGDVPFHNSADFSTTNRLASGALGGGAYAGAGSGQDGSQDYQQQNARRQDSYDRVRKYLRLDVDMGFQAERDTGIQFMAPRRQRSHSDVGIGYREGGTANAYEQQETGIPSPPPFVVVQGGVTDKTPIAMSSGVDWATEAAKQRRMQQMAPLSNYQNSANFASYNGIAPPASMDPHLLQQQIQQQSQSSYPSQQYEPASGPVRQREGSASGRGSAAPYPSHSRTSSSGSLVPFAAPDFDEGAYSGALADFSTPLQRSHSHRGQRNRHSRLAQSEDLSQLARMSNPTEFLNRITAPDGSLAPPNAQASGVSMGPPSSTFAAQSRNSLSRINTAVHDQQAAFPGLLPSMMQYGGNGRLRSPDEAQVLAMNRYGSVRGVSSPQHSQGMYSQTLSPLYGSLHPESSMSNLGQSAYEMEARSYPIVQQVTTSATQAASASRRKNDAIHVCPIAGCGSTFTRKFNLNGHIRSHTGERPYVCRAPGCTKSFARSFDLSRHEKLHAGIKPHTCDSCGKSFARADALARHLRNDAGNGGCLTRNSDAESTLDGSSSSQHGDRAFDTDEGKQFMASTVDQAVSPVHNKAQQSRFKGHVL